MQVLTTVTQKGQITLPVRMRRTLGIKPYSKVKVSLVRKALRVEPTVDIFDIAPIGKAPKGMNALKAREYMATHYRRI